MSPLETPVGWTVLILSLLVTLVIAGILVAGVVLEIARRIREYFSDVDPEPELDDDPALIVQAFQPQPRIYRTRCDECGKSLVGTMESLIAHVVLDHDRDFLAWEQEVAS